MSLLDHTEQKDNRSEVEIAVDKAVKETEEKVLRNIRAKSHASVLGAGPSSGPPTGQYEEDDPRLKNSKAHGGSTNVLAARLKERRENL